MIRQRIAVFYSVNARIFHRHKCKISGNGRGEILGDADAGVVSHPLQPVEEIGVFQTQSAYQRNHQHGYNHRRWFGAFDMHAGWINKKPAQLKAALV